MSRLPLETLAIVNETLDEVEAVRAAVMLRMWHHLESLPEQEALFDAIAGDGRQTLIEAFLAALRQRVRTRWPALRPSIRLCGDHTAPLETAFRAALGDVLGRRANGIVLDAWGLTLRDFLTEMCRQLAP